MCSTPIPYDAKQDLDGQFMLAGAYCGQCLLHLGFMSAEQYAIYYDDDPDFDDFDEDDELA
jgi:hypothetical protein